MKNQLVWWFFFRPQCDDSLFGWLKKCGGSFLKCVQTPIWINDHSILKALHLCSTSLFSASNFACHAKNKGKKFQMDLTFEESKSLQMCHLQATFVWLSYSLNFDVSNVNGNRILEFYHIFFLEFFLPC